MRVAKSSRDLKRRRAAVSIASNLAEGSARGTRKDFKQFVQIARGSNCELQTQFVIARRLQFGVQQKIDDADQLSHEVGQMLSGLAKYLSTSEKPKRRSTEN